MAKKKWGDRKDGIWLKNIPAMNRKTTDHLDLGTRLFAEASFSYKGWFCSVDILARNTDGSYDIYEVKSSKPDKPTNNNPRGLKKDHLIDVAYQRYVLQKCGLKDILFSVI